MTRKKRTTGVAITASVSIGLLVFCGAETRADEDTRLKWDAAVLSQGTGTDGFINREMETAIMAALKVIRAKFPEVAQIRARSSFPLDRLMVGLTKEGLEIISRKVSVREGSQKIPGATGIRSLDELNAKFDVSSVSTFLSPDLLMVEFKNPMDIPALTKLYEGIPEVDGVESDMRLGGGDEIHLKRADQVWFFAFKHGWGDCESGCINNQYYFFTYRPNTQAVKKTGEHTGGLTEEEMWQKAEGRDAK